MSRDDRSGGVEPGPPLLLDREPPSFPSIDAQEAPAVPDVVEGKDDAAPALDLVLDIPIRLTVELGRAEMPIRDIVRVGRGSIIDLDGVPGQPLDVRVNGVLIGRGEIVVIDEERLGLRLVEVVSAAERVRRLR